MLAGDNEPSQNMDDDLDIVNDDVGGGSGRLVVVGFRDLERHLGGGGRHGRLVAREEEVDRKFVVQSQSHLRRNQEDHLSGTKTQNKTFFPFLALIGAFARWIGWDHSIQLFPTT